MPAPNPVELTGAQRRALRALGHHLDAVLQIGQRGITEALIEATTEALDRHELIKVSVGREAPVDRHEGPDLLAQATGSHVAQVLGRTALLYRRRFDDPAVELPGVIVEAPRPPEVKVVPADPRAKAAPRQAAPAKAAPAKAAPAKAAPAKAAPRTAGPSKSGQTPAGKSMTPKAFSAKAAPRPTTPRRGPGRTGGGR